jgi:hypothetical protein
MAETRRKFDHDFREGAVRLVRETGKPIVQVARDLGINEGTLANRVNADRRRRGEGRTARWARMSGRSWSGCAGPPGQPPEAIGGRRTGRSPHLRQERPGQPGRRRGVVWRGP